MVSVLTAVLVTAGVILAATRDALGGGALIAVALVATQLLPKAIECHITLVLQGASTTREPATTHERSPLCLSSDSRWQLAPIVV
jgi:hypothetical protein